MTDKSCEERKIAAWIRYNLHIDPDSLTEEEFWLRWGELRYCMNKDTNRWDFKFEDPAEKVTEEDVVQTLLLSGNRKKAPKNINTNRFKKGISK